MVQIARCAGNLPTFAASAVGLERTIFGSVVQDDTLTLNMVTADFIRGWGIVPPSSPPSKQDFNGAFYSLSFLLTYLHQMGVAEWDIAQEYFLGSATITGGELYISKVTPNTGNDPATDSASWKLMAGIEDIEDAVSIIYDNAASGLVATDVQAAIDELRNAAKIKYDNTIVGVLAATDVQDAIDEIIPSLVPAGAIQFFAMASAPTGWLQADGANVSRTTYATLFAALGTLYGVGDGATTFGLPDMRGQFARGVDDGRGLDIARVMGSDQTDAMEQHSHHNGVAFQSAETAAYAACGSMSNPIGAVRRATGVDLNPVLSGVTSGVIDSSGVITNPSFGATSSCKSPSTETRPTNVALYGCIKY